MAVGGTQFAGGCGATGPSVSLAGARKPPSVPRTWPGPLPGQLTAWQLASLREANRAKEGAQREAALSLPVC